MRQAVIGGAEPFGSFGVMAPCEDPKRLTAGLEECSVAIMCRHFKTEDVAIKSALTFEIFSNKNHTIYTMDSCGLSTFV